VALLGESFAVKVDALTYRPNRPAGVLTIEGQRVFNVYHPPRVKAKEGNPKPWLDFLAHMFPEPADRENVARYLATMIARPDIRMKYGLIMVSKTQGAGKFTILEEVIAPLLGQDNIRLPSSSDILNRQFTAWKGSARAILIHEIYGGGDSRAYNKLKR